MADIWMGASREFTTLAAAVNAASDGDTIYIDAGVYENDFVVIHKELTLVGVGGKAHFTATEQIGNGKAIIVANASLTIDNLEFSGANVADENGAGIRYQQGTLVVRNSSFHDNENGILGGAQADGRIEVYNSSFVDNGFGDGFTHGLYAGKIDTLIVRDSLFEATFKGSHIKSRAENAEITGNRLIDGDGQSNYGVDLSNAGNAMVVGNWFEQAADTSNRHMIAYGPEGANPGTLTVAGNTMINFRPLATAVRNWTDNEASVTNNTFVDISLWINGTATASGNVDAELADVLANAAPTLGDDAASGEVDSTIAIDVLANDSDSDGGTLTVAAVGAAGNGTVQVNGDGTLTYTPTVGFVGDDTFDYWVVDGQGGVDRATVTVSVVEPSVEPPVEPPAEPPAGLAPDEIAGLNVWFDASDLATLVDSDGDGRLNAWLDKSGAGHTASASGNFEPVAIAGGVTFDGVDDGFSLADASDLNTATSTAGKTFTIAFTTGTDVAGRQVLYEQGGSVRGANLYIEDGEVHLGAWNLNEQQWGPSFVAGAIAAETTYVATLTFDANAGTISGSLNGVDLGSVGGVGLLYQHIGDIGLGWLNGSSMFADGSTSGGRFSFGGTLHEVAFHDRALDAGERDGLQSYLSDKWGLGVAAPVNLAPDAIDDAAATMAGTGVVADLLVNDTDPEGDTLSVSAVGAAGNGTVTDNGDGTVTYTPTVGFVGDDSFSYTIDDGNGGSDTAMVSISVTAPPAGVAPDAIAGLNVWFDGSDLATLVDSDGDGRLNSWLDKSGAGHTAGASGNFEPLQVADGVAFDGTDDGFSLADAVDLNTAVSTAGKTFAIAFTTGGDVAGRQVLYEQGGSVRGVNLYVEDGEVHLGAWNLNEQQWGPSFVAGAVAANTTYVATLTFDASAGTVSGTLDGADLGSVAGAGLLYQHIGDIGLGWLNGSSMFEDGTTSGGRFSFDGILHEVAFYDRALDGAEVGGLSEFLTDKWDADVLIG